MGVFCHMDAQCLCCYGGAILALIGAVVLLFIRFTSTKPNLTRYDDEKSFIDPKSGKRIPFPSILDEASVYLSIIVPSYNEEERLPIMLDETLEYMQERQTEKPSFTYEIIVVDDGSRDKTSQVALKYAEQHGTDRIRVLTLVKNRGKGGAVRLGMLSARGEILLFADADGATKVSDLIRLENALHKDAPQKTDMAISCGSRAHLQEAAVAERTLLRNFLMHGFHFVVWSLCVRGVQDTQCGFKLLTRRAATLIFYTMHVDRWAFDVELLYVAQQLKIPISEVAVNWQEIEGSKMTPLFSWIQMARDLVLISLRYATGGWKIEPVPSKSS
eukprot:scpid38482/ scgid20079/ Dolichyl-phosphate beta-glucosyltransferase; Asparagine-linked glycosylation protein 5 homolog